MNFFGVGLPEIFLVLVIALIVVGPRRLPETAANIGRTVRTIRRYAATVTAQVKEEFADLEAEYEAMKTEADKTGSGLRDVTTAVEGEARALEDDIAQVTSDVNRSLREESVIPGPSSDMERSEIEAGTRPEEPRKIFPLEKRQPPA